MLIRIIFIGMGLALLSGCAGNGPRPVAPLAVPGVDQNASVAHNDIYYHLILAEIASQRNQLDVSVDHLQQASRLVADPLIAERATRIAFYAKDTRSAFAAAQYWVELDPDNVEALQAAAALALNEGKDEAALDYLKKILKHEEDGPEHGFQVVASLLSRDRDKHDVRALDIMAKIVVEHPDNPYAHLALGDLAMLLGHLPAAEQALNKALSIDPDLPAALVSHARVIYQQGRVDDALASLRLAVTDIPDNEPLRLAYGRMLLEAKRYQQAKEQFTLLSEVSPEDSDYLYTLSLLALDLDEADQAEVYLQRLLELGERGPEAYYYLGRIAESRHDFETAIKQYERVGRSEYQFDAQIRIGQLLAETGHIEAGLGHLRSLRMANPESSVTVRLYLTESAVLSAAERYGDAIDLLSEALQVVPGNTDLLYSRSLLYEKTDRIDLLEQDLRAVLLREPGNADALNALGYSLANLTTRYDEAYDLILQAIKLKPDEAAIIDSMGWVLYRMGRAEEAVAYLRRALSLQYDNEIAGHLSEVLWVVGQRKAAKTLLENALEKSPGDKTLLQVKEQLDASQIEP
ncbi:MAG: tetratricopeptide repeat protein [Gammaproteobacteria bacterium]|nr:tetratricopeptide repeat protein [Gammaproteobacteria bacterium]